MSIPGSGSPPYHPLHGVRLKLNRAQAYAEALNREIDLWFENNPYAVFGEYEAGTPEHYVFKVRFLEDIPIWWGLTLGDFAHNARSALEHLAYQVVLFGIGHEPRGRTAFPIFEDPAMWKRTPKSLRGATKRHISIIESFQPYHRTDIDGSRTVDAAYEDPLLILRCLSNIDKHTVLNTMPAMIQSMGWDVEAVRDVASIVDSHAPLGIMTDGCEFVRAQIVSCGPEPEAKLNRTENVEIWIQQRVNMQNGNERISYLELKKTMEQILGRLREIFQVFVGEFR